MCGRICQTADAPHLWRAGLAHERFFDDELGVDWNQYPNVRDWLQRIRSEPRWKHPYDLLPGHPIPKRAG